MKRYWDTLKREKAKTSDNKRNEFITRENFEDMYACVYKQMVTCGVAMELNDPILYDSDGMITEDADAAVGLPSKYIIHSPDNILMVDETGSNTNQKSDGRIGGELMIVPTDGSCNGINGSVADAHFPTLVFQTASGDSVCCCVIFKSAGT